MTPITVRMTPPTPGTFIKHTALPEEMSVAEAARHLGVSRQSLYALLNDQRSITPEMAKRFELAFGISAAMLINHQAWCDRHAADQREAELAEEVTPFEWPQATSG